MGKKTGKRKPHKKGKNSSTQKGGLLNLGLLKRGEKGEPMLNPKITRFIGRQVMRRTLNKMVKENAFTQAGFAKYGKKVQGIKKTWKI